MDLVEPNGFWAHSILTYDCADLVPLLLGQQRSGFELSFKVAGRDSAAALGRAVP